MIDSNLNPTARALQLAKENTVAKLRELLQDEFGVKPPSKAIKIEIAQQLDDMRHNAKQAESEQLIEEAQSAEDGQAQARLWYDNPNADTQVFQGALHEATTPEVISDTLRGLANSATGIADALNTMGLVAQEAARKLAAVAWANRVAVVRSMGRTVRGKVVDTVLRTPGPDGMGRVCLVVEHPNGAPGRKATRTLHALADVQFEAMAS